MGASRVSRTIGLAALSLGPALLPLGPATRPVGPASLAAQEIGTTASLDRTRVGVGQSFTLDVTVSGTQRLDDDPTLPDVSAFATFLGSGTQTSMQIVNGRTTVSYTIRYRFQATTEGSWEVGGVTVRAEGQTITTDPIRLEVTAEPQPTPGAGGARGAPAAEPGVAEIGPEDLFIIAEPDRRRVLENQPVIVRYRLFTRVDVNTYSVTRLPSTAGFWVEELEMPQRPQVEQVERNGQAYATAVLRKVALYPTGPGTKTIEPLAIEAQVRLRGRAADPFDDLLGGLRGSVFGEMVSAGAASRPVDIEVLPLPAAGRPSDFTGLVGTLAVASSIDRDSVAVNEAVTLRVEVSGTGNLKALAAPDLAFPPTVEAFPPEVTDRLSTTDRGVSGSRVYEYVLVPRAPGTLAIPGVDLSYFDPDAREYRTASAEPLDLVVSGRAVEGAIPGARARSDVEELRTDIRFIRTEPSAFRPRGGTLFGEWLFWVVLVAPVGAIGGAAGLRRRRERLEGDPAYARNRRAARLAKRRLAQARELARADDPRAFYAETARALEGFAADKLHTSAAGIIREELGEALRGRGVGGATVDEYLELLATCDRQRFAPGGDTAAGREAFLDRAAGVLATMTRELGR